MFVIRQSSIKIYVLKHLSITATSQRNQYLGSLVASQLVRRAEKLTGFIMWTVTATNIDSNQIANMIFLLR